MKYGISQKTQPTHQRRICMAPNRHHDSDDFGVHVSVLSVTYILWTWGSPQIRPQKSEKKPEKMHSTTGKVVFQTHLQDLMGPDLSTMSHWITSPLLPRWFMIPRCQIWWQKTPSYARNWAWKRRSKWPASCSRIWWQTLGFQVSRFFPIGGSTCYRSENPPEDPKKKPGRRSRNAFQEITGCSHQLMLGKMVAILVKGWITKKNMCHFCVMFPSNACNWRLCWNVNELQKRWCEISDGWNVLKYHCNLKFAWFPPERAHLFRYTFDCCSCDLRQDEDDAGPQSYKQKQEGKPGSDMFWPFFSMSCVAMCSLQITWERLTYTLVCLWPGLKWRSSPKQFGLPTSGNRAIPWIFIDFSESWVVFTFFSRFFFNPDFGDSFSPVRWAYISCHRILNAEDAQANLPPPPGPIARGKKGNLVLRNFGRCCRKADFCCP